MKIFKFIVEGDGDVKFMTDFVKEHYNVDLDKKAHFIKLDGYTNLKNVGKLIIKNSENGGINSTILDADYPRNGGGYTQRLAEIEQIVADENLDIDLFLLPDNQSNGDLETFLENIINQNNQDIFNCWNQYEQCISGVRGKNYTIPAKKSKIYSYLECLLPDTKAGKKLVKDPSRDYRNQDHWILGDLQNHYVISLKNHLDKLFE